MARTVFEFDMYGVNYRSTPFSAIEGLEITEFSGKLHPTKLLRLTEAEAEDGSWLSLSKPRVIDRHVRDKAGVLAAHLVLGEIVLYVREVNFGFLKSWKSVEVPSRFILPGFTPRKRENSHPIVSRLEDEQLATYRELEEYYSLKDAYDMFDRSCLRAVNAALANERAEYEAKLKAKAKG